MTPHYSDDWLTVYGGDVRDVLPTFVSNSVDCIVTSPPYWGLRDYGTATWTVDLDDERIGREFIARHWEKSTAELRAELEAEAAAHDHSLEPDAGVTTQRVGQQGHPHRSCSCGATRQDSQLGLEATPEEYVANLVGVFRELRRVLKPTGTCWLNLGDSYASTTSGTGARGGSFASERSQWQGEATSREIPFGLKPKDLVGIPWRVAFALQADGWWLRSDIIWSKPNPMPESVTDRPTKAHEYLFLLTKSARYYYDAAAVAEPAVFGGVLRSGYAPPGQEPHSGSLRPAKKRGEFNGKTEAMPGRNAFRAITATRNLRSVWTIATRPYPGAHFAVFPPELPERCIKAGCPELGTVLDPFAGSGTVGLVANRLSRRAILIDLNAAYLDQQMKRNAQTVVGL